MVVDAAEAALGQLVSQAGAQHGGAVQAEDRIDLSGMFEGTHQLLCHSLGLGQAGLGQGNINIVIDMGVVGGEVAPCNPEGGHCPGVQAAS